ncbi:MAG: CARDB domain-containing protein [Methanobacterium sp.]
MERFDAPDRVRLHQTRAVNVTVKNRGKSRVETCTVALYVNSTPADTPEQKQSSNYTRVGTVSIEDMGVNETKYVKFYWSPRTIGNNVLKAVIYAVDDADKSNNVAFHNVNVLKSALVLVLNCGIDVFRVRISNSISNFFT